MSFLEPLERNRNQESQPYSYAVVTIGMINYVFCHKELTASNTRTQALITAFCFAFDSDFKILEHYRRQKWPLLTDLISTTLDL